MNYERGRREDRTGDVVIGILLVLVGLVFFAAQFLNIDLGRLAWPLFVIVPGLAVIVLGLILRGASGEPLTVLGSMVTVTGLILAYQNAYDLWATWAYAWALIAPTSVGVGRMLYGAVTGRGSILRDGTRTAVTGLAIFLVAAAFFEGVIGLSGFGISNLGGYIFPVALIGLGVILLFTNLLGGRRRPAGETQRYTAPRERRPEPPVERADIAGEDEPWPPKTDPVEPPAESRADDDTLEIHKRPE